MSPGTDRTRHKLLASRPNAYRCFRDKFACTLGANETNYVAVVGANTATGDEQAEKSL